MTRDRFGAALRQIGDDYLRRHPRDPLLAQQAALERVRGRRRRHLIALGVAVAAVLPAVLAMTLVVPEREAAPVFPSGAISTVRVGNAPVSLAVLDDAVAVGHAANEAVRLVDAETGEVTTLDVEWSVVESAGDEVWGLNAQGVARFCHLRSGHCSDGLAVPPADLLRAHGESIYLTHLDPSIRLGDDAWVRELPGQRVSAVAATGSIVAVATVGGHDHGHVLLFDGATGEELARVRVRRALTDLVWVDGELWGTSPEEPDYHWEPGKLFRFDARDLAFDSFGTGNDRMTSLAVGDRVLWGVSESQGTVAAFDLATGRRVRGPLEVGTSLSDLAFGHGALWASDLTDDVLVRIDPQAVPEVAAPTPTKSSRCSTIPFRPTYLPPGFSNVTQAPIGPAATGRALARWAGPDERASIEIGLATEGDLVAPRSLQVLGVTGSVGRLQHPTPEVVAVDFPFRGCEWRLIGYGLGEPDLRTVAERLVPTMSAAHRDACLSKGVPFRSTNPPPGWAELPTPASDEEAAAGHFRTRGGGAVMVVFSEDVATEATQRSDVPVLANSGTIEEHDEGLVARFSFEGCRYALIAPAGTDVEEFRAFVRSLKPAGRRPGHVKPFAVWPEALRSDGERACERAAESGETWRRDREQTALRFGDKVLGWHPEPIEAGALAASSDDGRLQVRDGDVAAWLTLRRFRGCWWVTHANVVAGRGVTSYSVSADTVTVTTAPRDAAVAMVEAAFNGKLRVSNPVRPGRLAQIRFEKPITTAGYILVLYRDAEGRVVDVYAAALAPGDAAG